MRLTAISIPVLSSLLLAACTPQPPLDLRKELSKLDGPSPGTMNDSLQGQAENALAAHNYALAAQTYKQLADKNPGNKEYTLGLADSLRRAGSNQDALTVLEPYLAKYPSDASALETKGLCLMNLGNIAEAGKTFEQALAAEPDRWRTLNAVGILFTMKGKAGDAIDYYDEALKSSNGNVSVMNNKALTLAMDNRFEEAITTFQAARKSLRVGSPDMKQVDMNLALVYAIAGRLEEAEQTASPYLSKAALYNNMGVYADLAKNKAMARSYLNMALTQSPVYYERAWKNLGTLAEEDKNEKLPRPEPKTIPIAPDAASEKATPANERSLTQPEQKKAGQMLKPPAIAPEGDVPPAE